MVQASRGQVQLEEHTPRLGRRTVPRCRRLVGGDRDLRRSGLLQLRDGVQGAAEEQYQQGLEPVRIAHHRRRRRPQLDHEAHLLLSGQGLEQRLDRPDQGVRIQGYRALGQGPGGSAQLLDQVAGPERLGRDCLEMVSAWGA
jgi:hypothetical protein